MSSAVSYSTHLSNEDEDEDYIVTEFSADKDKKVAKGEKDNYEEFMSNFTVSNSKVRYYCHKTLSMRQPLHEIVDDLVKLQYYVMAYLPQDPVVTDHYALSTVFTLISKTAALVEWGSLNRDCFWNDFCRETRELKFCIDRIHGVALECLHTVTERANRALEILNDVVQIGQKTPDIRLKESMFQTADEPTLDGIKVMWMEPRETVIIQWKDFGDEVQSIKLQQTADSFRIRFLRCLIFYARKCLELTFFTFLRVDVALRLEIPLEKLEKCNGLTSGQLLAPERAALTKAKREFDGSWDDIWGTVTRFKMQLDQLQKHKADLKGIRKDPKYIARLKPHVDSFTMQIEDPLLLKVVSQAICSEVRKESYDFSVFPDRTEDLFGIIEDMWIVDKTSYKTMDMLLILLYTAMNQIKPVLEKREENVFKKDISNLFVQRNRVKRYLKSALDVFKHNVFLGMAIQQNGYTQLKNTARSFSKLGKARSDFLENENDEYDEDDENDSDGLMWIELQGGYKVTISEEKQFLVQNQFRDQLHFTYLDEEQKVVLTTKLLARLIHHVAIEGCRAKIVVDRAKETKSLLKRMKPKDRSTEYLGIVIGNGVYHIQQLLKLMKTMNVIRLTPR